MSHFKYTVIGNIRKEFSLPSDTQPIDFATSPDGGVTTLDKTVLVSCALNNTRDSVVAVYHLIDKVAS